jgi:hypothetical protein
MTRLDMTRLDMTRLDMTRLDMTGTIFDSRRTPPSEEEDQDDECIGDIEKISISALSDEEATHSIILSYQKKKTHPLKKWRIWNHENKMVFLFFVIMLVFLALTLHARSQ